MSKKILQINFNFEGAWSQMEEGNLEVAKWIAEVPGLIWKIWRMNDAEGEGGGTYLFDDELSMQSYLEQVMPRLKSIAILSDIVVKQYDIDEDLTAITHGPVK
ncbi:MAG: YdhR family protein [Pseudomonadales bacterium]